MTAYRFTGTEPAQYWGWTAKPGDVAAFPNAAPDDKWEEVAEEETPAAVDDQGDGGKAPADEPPQRPNKAAPAADWVAFAQLDGTFQTETGLDPADEKTTRKAIVDFYYAGEGDA